MLTNCGLGQQSHPAAAQVVGPAGALITAANGIEVRVPANALSSNVILAVRQLHHDIALDPPYQASGVLVELLPHAQTFDVPVVLTLPCPAADARVLRLDSDEDTTWEIINDVQFADGVAHVTTSRFGYFMVSSATAPTRP